MSRALITGASSGIGYEMAKALSKGYGFDVVLVSRNKEKLLEVAKDMVTQTTIIVADLTTSEGIQKVIKETENEPIEVLINNAGFGYSGAFNQTPLVEELNMIDLNVKALHYLMKEFLQRFEKQKKGYILNVGSIAGYMDGPYMSTYFATKNYVKSLTRAVATELKQNKSKVSISLLAPGPVHTGFGKRAKSHEGLELPGTLNPDFVAAYTLKRLFKGKLEIVPGRLIRLLQRLLRIIPSSFQRTISSRVYRG